MPCVFEKSKLKETCLPYFAEGFKIEICRYDGKSFALTYFLKNEYL